MKWINRWCMVVVKKGDRVVERMGEGRGGGEVAGSKLAG